MKDRLKRYTCRICKEKFEMMVSDYSKNSMTPFKRSCMGIDCKTKIVMGEVESQRSKRKAKDREVLNQMREKIKTISDYKSELQQLVNWIAKEIDKQEKCISHPNQNGFLRYDAGHYWTVKVHSDIRFNFHNIHKQNSEANQRHGGCPEYIVGIIKRYGQEYADMLLGLPFRFKGIDKAKFNIRDMRDIYLPNARKLKQEIKNGLEVTRDEANDFIGIYETRI